jgi:hypothetical protein
MLFNLQAGQPAFYVPEYLHSRGIKVIPMYVMLPANIANLKSFLGEHNTYSLVLPFLLLQQCDEWLPSDTCAGATNPAQGVRAVRTCGYTGCVQVRVIVVGASATS